MKGNSHGYFVVRSWEKERKITRFDLDWKHEKEICIPSLNTFGKHSKGNRIQSLQEIAQAIFGEDCHWRRGNSYS